MANPNRGRGEYVNGRNRPSPQTTSVNPSEPTSPSAALPPKTNGMHAPPAPGQGYFPSGGRRGFEVEEASSIMPTVVEEGEVDSMGGREHLLRMRLHCAGRSVFSTTAIWLS